MKTNMYVCVTLIVTLPLTNCAEKQPFGSEGVSSVVSCLSMMESAIPPEMGEYWSTATEASASQRKVNGAYATGARVFEVFQEHNLLILIEREKIVASSGAEYLFNITNGRVWSFCVVGDEVVEIRSVLGRTGAGILGDGFFRGRLFGNAPGDDSTRAPTAVADEEGRIVFAVHVASDSGMLNRMNYRRAAEFHVENRENCCARFIRESARDHGRSVEDLRGDWINLDRLLPYSLLFSPPDTIVDRIGLSDGEITMLIDAGVSKATYRGNEWYASIDQFIVVPTGDHAGNHSLLLSSCIGSKMVNKDCRQFPHLGSVVRRVEDGTLCMMDFFPDGRHRGIFCRLPHEGT